MKVIRALRPVFVPANPEKSDGSMMTPVKAGVVALIPSDFKLPSDSYNLVHEFEIKKDKNKSKEK